MPRRDIPDFEELQKPLSLYDPRYYYFKLISLLLRTVGSMSEGIRLGFEHGFDSGTIMNYIYENTPNGMGFIGKQIDASFLDQTTCKAFRSIREIQREKITKFLEGRVGKKTFIADLASGKADYLYDVLGEKEYGVEVLLRDINEKTLAESRAIAERLDVGDKITYELGDALDPGSLGTISTAPDLVVEVGLYGIIHDDELLKKHMFDLKEILNPGALLFNVQTYNEQIELIARALVNQEGEPCVWHLRPVELVISWAEEAGFREPEITMDPYGIYAVVMMRN